MYFNFNGPLFDAGLPQDGHHHWLNAFNVYVLLAQITVYTVHNITVTFTVFYVEIIVPLDGQVTLWRLEKGCNNINYWLSY